MRIVILEPPPDRPWKAGPAPRGPAQALQRADVRAVRGAWAEFAAAMEAAFGRAGHAARRVEAAPGEVTRELLGGLDADAVLVPHRHRAQVPEARPRLWFYMQTPLPRLFTVDPRGWSAAASFYPWRDGGGTAAPAFGFDALAERLIRANASKFEQPGRRSRMALALSGDVPLGRYIFFPCQIPHDENVLRFFDGAEVDIVAALARWADGRRVPLVLKEHPMNRKSMAPLREAAAGSAARWSEASVHDLIRGAAAVYTINSGVGLEAILHGRPVVAFGRSEYDAVTIPGDPGDLDTAWDAARRWDRAAGTARYRRFIEDFTGRIAYDLDNPDLGARLDRLAATVAAG